MRFILAEESWILDALSPTEWQLISEIPLIASGIHFTEKTRERLFPSPLANDALADEETITQLEDWDELIKPDLMEAFETSRDTVQSDLDKVETVPVEQVLPPEEADHNFAIDNFYRLEVKIENTELWYSALNQARLLLNEEYDLADSGDRLLIQMEGPDAVDENRLLLLAQYEIYSVIQNILIESVMEGQYAGRASAAPRRSRPQLCDR